MDSPTLLIVALAILAYGLTARHLRRAALTSPILFTALGVLLGSAVLDLLDVDIASPQIVMLAQLTLVFVLFADAAAIDLRLLRADRSVPLRLLLIGLPLAILLGTGAALLLMPELGIWRAALLAAMLAPTDAALSRQVLVDKRVPQRIRQTINAESGLNNGLALPPVLFLLAMSGGPEAGAGAADNPLALLAGFLLGKTGLGVLVGAAGGALGGYLVERAVRSGEMDRVYERLSAVALALSAYAGASLIGADGFVAAFTAGMGFGLYARRARKPAIGFGETEGQLLVLITFVIFGASLLPHAADALNGGMAGFALLSLFAIRPLAVWIALTGTGLVTTTRLFFGWFGPRGIVSIVFALMVQNRLGAEEAAPLLAVVALTVGLSVVLHGVTARPLAGLYAKRLEARGDKDALAEFAKVEHGADLKRGRF